MATTTEESPYDVTGIIINAGQSPLPTPDDIPRILATLREQVPKFSALWRGEVTAELMGQTSGDILVSFDAKLKPTIEDTWDAVHALVKSLLVADAEPAVGVPVQDEEARDTEGNCGDDDEDDNEHLPGSKEKDWNLRKIGLPLVGSNVTGKGVKVAHPDTGYTQHPEIIGPRLLVGEGYDFKDNKTNPSNPLRKGQGHGTATASVIMTGPTPPKQVHGIAPGVTLVPLRVSDSVIHFNFANLAKALTWARRKECHIVSMSLGGPWAGRALRRAAREAEESGMILLAAAGNVWPCVVYPARLDEVAAVAASNANDQPWRSSASGETVDITAPGESVWRAVTYKNGSNPRYCVKRSSGTSYAVATTAGLCALWMEHHGVQFLKKKYGGGLSKVFLSLLRDSYRQVAGWKTHAYGRGILDAPTLLRLPLPAHAPAALHVAAAPPGRMMGFQVVDRLQHYFPELSSQQLAKATDAILGDSGRATSSFRAETVEHPTLNDEVEFYVATDPAVRAEFVAAARGKMRAPGSPAKRAFTPGESGRLKALASPLLKAVLEERESRALRHGRKLR